MYVRTRTDVYTVIEDFEGKKTVYQNQKSKSAYACAIVNGKRKPGDMFTSFNADGRAVSRCSWNAEHDDYISVNVRHIERLEYYGLEASPNIQPLDVPLSEENAQPSYHHCEKEILERGYVTHALTDEYRHIYGHSDDDFKLCTPQILHHRFWWSEVYCEPGVICAIIRRGEELDNVKNVTQYDAYLNQSKVNIGD